MSVHKRALYPYHTWRPGIGFTVFEELPIDLRGHSTDRPIWLHPDWPPHSELAFAIYHIKCSRLDLKTQRKRIEKLRKKWEAPQPWAYTSKAIPT
jgi:hypothetical protein